MRERYVLLGLARAQAEWFRAVGQWSTGGLLPAEFLRCVSLEELRTRLRSGRAFSAAIIDGTVPGLDRDLIAEARAAGASVLVVDDAGGRDWRGLGAAAVLATRFSRDELLEVLGATSAMVGAATIDHRPDADTEPAALGTFVAVTGPGGAGASTVAVALAQGLAAGEGRMATARRASRSSGEARPQVLLADLCRVADQAMLHDAQVLVPSVQELVEAHRTSIPSRRVLFAQTFAVQARGYRLLLGLRRPRHWVALRPRALGATLDSLQRLVDVVVADIEADLEGEAETGSTDVEGRNLLARACAARAHVVVVVGEPSMKGMHAMVRVINELTGFGVPIDRILPVVNRSPRLPRARAELTRTLARLSASGAEMHRDRLSAPLYLPDRPVDQALRDGVALPAPMARSLARAVGAVLERVGAPARDVAVPQAVVPGSLTAFAAQDPPTEERRS